MDAPSHLLLSSLQTLFGGHMDLNVRVLSREASVWFMSIRMEEVEDRYEGRQNFKYTPSNLAWAVSSVFPSATKILQKFWFWFSQEIMFGIWQHREMAMHQNRNTQQALLKVLYRKQWTLNTNSRTTVQNLTCTLYHRLIISLFGLETIKTKLISLVWGVEINKLFNNTQTTCAAGNEKAEVTLEYNIVELVLPFSLFQVKSC